MTTPGRRPARSALAAALLLAVPILSVTVLTGGPAAAERGGPAAPAPPVAVAAAQTQPGDRRPPSPPADPPAEQARVPEQLPAAPPAVPPAAPPAAPPAGPPAVPSSGNGEVATGAGDAPVVDTTAGERVVICKYVRKPYVAEIPSHVIIVNEQALVGRGFPGTFPWAFSDAHFHSVAIRWAAAGEQAREVSLEECPTAPTGGGGTGGSTGGSGFGNETVQPPLRPSWQVERPESAPVPTGSLPTVSGLPQTGAPSGLEALLLLSSTALLAGVALRVHARRALP